MQTLQLNIYDIGICIKSTSDFVFDNLRKDFHLFLSDHPKDSPLKAININIFNENPPYEKVPPLTASIYDLGLICYKDKNVHYVDYSGKGLMIYDFDKEQADIYSQDENLLYERVKLLILSRIGELFDRQRMYRIHALGLSKNEKATLCLLPMAGGKTTTVLNVLNKDKNINMISDDMCFVRWGGVVYPFVLRLGARDKKLLQGIPEEIITGVSRIQYGRKFLIDPVYFRERVSKECEIKNILIGKRMFRKETEINKIAKIKCFIPFIQSGVFGLGLPQLIDYFKNISFFGIDFSSQNV